MKKCIMISLSVIFTIMILLIPGNKILAWNDTDYININYDHENVSYYIETYSDFLEYMDSKLKEYVSQTGYKYVVYFGANNNLPLSNSTIYYNVAFFNTEDNIYIRTYFRPDYVSGITLLNNTHNPSFLHYVSFTYDKFLNGDYNDLENLFEYNKLSSFNDSYFRTGLTYSNSFPNASDIFNLVSERFYFPYDTNSNLVLKKTHDYFLPVSFDGGTTIHRDGDTFLTYKTNNPGIVIDSSLMCDLEGRDMHNVVIDFENVFNNDYRYQYKTINSDWIDITDKILVFSLSDYYKYQFTTYYNTSVEARVLDNIGNVVDSNSYIVTGLFDYVYNSFNEIISADEYSKVEIRFILPTSSSSSYCTKDEYINGSLTEVVYECSSFDLDYDIFSSDKNGNIVSNIFGIPYVSKTYLYDVGNMNKTQTDTIPLGDDMSGFYQGSYSVENSPNILELKLVVDLSSIDHSYVSLNFNSSYEFEVVYYEKELEKEYIGSVDLTGKAGVMFVPKQIDDDMLLNFRFYPNLYSIQLRDTYKEKYKVLKYYSIGYCDDRDYVSGIPYICNDGTDYNVSVEFKKGNLEQSLYIVNRDYPNKNRSIVYYDTRYFTYVVYNTLADNPTINHPITNETIVLGSLLDFDSAITNQQSFFDSVMSALNHFKRIIFEIFDNISYFFNNLNIELKYFYIAVFSLIIFAFLIRFLL